MTPIEAISELKDYRACSGTKLPEEIEVAIQALERQIPKKVYHFADDTFETSCCGTDVTNCDYKYCPECGQLLGEVEDIEENEYDRE